MIQIGTPTSVHMAEISFFLISLIVTPEDDTLMIVSDPIADFNRAFTIKKIAKYGCIVVT
jgi:hypothetical protein